MTSKILTKEEINALFAEGDLSYDEAMEAVGLLPPLQREDLMEDVAEIQRNFWGSPWVAEYYTEVHPLLPPVPGHFEALVRTVDPRPGQTIVDLACGAGALVRALLGVEPQIEIVAIDFSSALLKALRQSLPLSANNGNVVTVEHDLRAGIPLQDGVVSTVTSNWGVVYLSAKDFECCLAEIQRVLEPGGRFVCSALIRDTNFSSLSFLEKLSALIFRISHRGLIQQALLFEEKVRRLFPIYLEKDLVRMMGEAGLTVIYREVTLWKRSTTLVAQKG